MALGVKLHGPRAPTAPGRGLLAAPTRAIPLRNRPLPSLALQRPSRLFYANQAGFDMKNSPLNVMPHQMPWMLKDLTPLRFPEGFNSASDQMLALVDACDSSKFRKVSDDFLDRFEDFVNAFYEGDPAGPFKLRKILTETFPLKEGSKYDRDIKTLLWTSAETFGSTASAHSTTSFLLYQLCGMFDMVGHPEKWPAPDKLAVFQDHYNLLPYNDFIEAFRMTTPTTQLNSYKTNLFLQYWMRKEKLFTRWQRAPEKVQVQAPFELFTVPEVFQLVDTTEVFFDTFPFFCSQNRFYHVPTVEMIEALADYLKKRYTELTTPKHPGGEPQVKPEDFVVLEVGAGSGKLVHFLESKHKLPFKIKATESDGNQEFVGFVEVMDQDEAIEEFQPTIILCSWMPAQDWPSQWRQFESVKEYILLGEATSGTSARAWETYGHPHPFNTEQTDDWPPFEEDGWRKHDLPEVSKWMLGCYDSKFYNNRSCATSFRPKGT